MSTEHSAGGDGFPLRDLGVDDTDEHVTDIYMHAVRHPGTSREDLLAQGYSQGLVVKAIADLSSHGLIRRSAADTWEAIPPEIAIPPLAARLDARAASIRSMAVELSQIYHRARTRADDIGEGITLLRSLHELTAATLTTASNAARILRSFRDNSPRNAHLFSLDLAAHRERSLCPDGRPIEVRTTYDVDILTLPRAGEVLQARAEGGERHRFIGEVPFTAVVADETCAVIDLTSYDSSGAGSLMIKDRRFVTALAALADTMWAMATPTALAGDKELDRRSVAILSLLAAGATDATIAAQTGISQRTVERKVRSLMDRLGASTRFQAGVQAARRGWI